MSIVQDKISLQTLTEISPSYLTDNLIHFELKPDLTASVRDYLKKSRDLLFQKMEEGFSPSRIVRLQSLLTDQMITALYKRAFEESHHRGVPLVPFTLLALGGYGRAEMNLFSDVDLLFLYEGKSSEQLEFIVKQMLYPLWDAQMEVGYSIRTLKDCKQVMHQDIRAMSSMLDARFLAGDQDLAKKFFEFLGKEFSSHKSLFQFVEAKTQETKERLKRFGGSVYLIEPNLKESEGGLRDWHLIRYYAWIALKTTDVNQWIEKDVLSAEEADTLQRSLEFLFEVRNRLHRRANRGLDQLTFEYQEPIAAEMKFTTGEGMLAVERFMQAYYSHAYHLHRLLEEVTRRLFKPSKSFLGKIKEKLKISVGDFFYNIHGVLVPKDISQLADHPLEIVHGFYLAQKHRLKLDEEFKLWAGKHRHMIDENYRCNPEVGGMLQEMFADVSGIGTTLEEMHDTRILGALIPEFEEILFQTQHDAYHIYTVDTHSVLAVQELSKLKNGEYDEQFPIFKNVLEEIQSPGSLVLGVLFHDIGKGKGGNHSEKGAELAKTITTRFGYSESERQMIEFLVRSHLLMPHISQRRDLEDANLIGQFAKSMENLERLNMLFLLTWADIRAVGPDVWTPWKGNLLVELYQKTKGVFETGEYNPERALTIMKQVKGEVSKLVSTDEAALKKYMDAMPPRYFLVNDPKTILQHFELVKHLPEDGVIFHHQPIQNQNINQILIYTLNTPKLFEQVTGVMAANQINILNLDVYRSSKGEVLIILKVTDHRGQYIDEERKLQTLKNDFREITQGKIYLEKYLQTRRGSGVLQKKAPPAKPPRVEIDNDVSAYYTVIDIYANDRLGLLYDLARSMANMGLYTEVSKISTKVDQVADVFYVKDIFGHKVTDKKKIAAIKETFFKLLSEGGTQGGTE